MKGDLIVLSLAIGLLLGGVSCTDNDLSIDGNATYQDIEGGRSESADRSSLQIDKQSYSGKCQFRLYQRYAVTGEWDTGAILDRTAAQSILGVLSGARELNAHEAGSFSVSSGTRGAHMLPPFWVSLSIVRRSDQGKEEQESFSIRNGGTLVYWDKPDRNYVLAKNHRRQLLTLLRTHYVAGRQPHAGE